MLCILWHCIASYGIAWPCMVLNNNVLCCMVLYWDSCYGLALLGISLILHCTHCMVLHSLANHLIVLKVIALYLKLLHGIAIYRTRSLGALRAPTSCWGPSGPLDFVLRALRALRPCDPRSFSQEGRHEVELPKNMDLLSLGSDDDYH